MTKKIYSIQKGYLSAFCLQLVYRLLPLAHTHPTPPQSHWAYPDPPPLYPTFPPKFYRSLHSILDLHTIQLFLFKSVGGSLAFFLNSRYFKLLSGCFGTIIQLTSECAYCLVLLFNISGVSTGSLPTIGNLITLFSPQLPEPFHLLEALA